MSTYDFYISHLMTGVKNDIKASFISGVKELPEDWGINLPPLKRMNSSKQMAKIYFGKTGEFTNYFNLNGSLVEFSPTEKDIKNREYLIKFFTESEIHALDYKYSGLYWLIASFISVFFGWVSTHNKHDKYFKFNG